jgi:hypothetical protein
MTAAVRRPILVAAFVLVPATGACPAGSSAPGARLVR